MTRSAGLTTITGVLGLVLTGACGGDGRPETSNTASAGTTVTTAATMTATMTATEGAPTTGMTAGEAEAGTTDALTGEGPGTGGEPCTFAEDCGEGEFCTQSGTCLPDGSCEVTADCGIDQECIAGSCQVPPPCNSDDECDAGEVCAVSGACIPEDTCEVDADCPGGEVCTVNANCVPPGGCDTTQDCEAGKICNIDKVCEPGGMCGAEEFQADPLAPNILMVLDRSCSMKDKINGVTKWDLAVAAINQLTMSYAAMIRWGLIMFPDITAPSCGQVDYPVPLGDGNEAAIQNMLTAAQTNADPWFPDGPCVTNIDTAIEQASLDPALFVPGDKSYVMLITDGKQAGCSDAGGDNGTETLLAEMFGKGVPSYVVGFGSAVDPDQMNAFADAGGVPLAGDPRYYQADNAAELMAAFDAIVGSLISCTFQLTNAPDDWTDVFVFFNDVLQVPFDPNDAEGWDYDEAALTVTFYGSFCQQLKDNEVWDIDIVFGCEEPAPL